MTPLDSSPTVSLAFRFHVNFYHSYRGDSLDELGIGKDLRIIRSIVADLDRLNSEGIAVSGTWDIENYYSLEQSLPKHGADIIEAIRRRVIAGADEVELMSYNNGIVAAHTDEELERAIGWGISNPAGSGVSDVFGEWAPIVRPQECMFTGSQIPVYRRLGIEAVSLYYSALPFNAFSTFVSPLPFAHRYNPLTLRSGRSDEGIILLPAYNHGDIADHWASLRSWLRAMRRAQLAATRKPAGRPDDLLLIIDMDADDDFWAGLDLPLVGRLFPSFGGLYRLVRSVCDLDYLRFARPNDYLRSHAPVGSISIDRDTADGSYDGYSSWAEKWTNTAVWSRIAEARRIADAARRITGATLPPPPDGPVEPIEAGDLTAPTPTDSPAAPAATDTPPTWTSAGADPASIGAVLDRSLTERLLAMSTTHFGLSSPVMNRSRLEDAFHWAGRSLDSAREAFALATRPDARAAEWGLVDFDSKSPRDERGAEAPVQTRFFDSEIDRLDRGAGALVPFGSMPAEVRRASGNRPGTEGPSPRLRQSIGGEELLRSVLNPATSVEAAGRAKPEPRIGDTVMQDDRLSNDLITAEVLSPESDPARVSLLYNEVSAVTVSAPWVRYGGKVRRSQAVRTEVRQLDEENALAPGTGDGGSDGWGAGEIRSTGTIPLSEGRLITWERLVTVVAGLPYLFIDLVIEYPETRDAGFQRAKARRLGRGWDARWQEVVPCELLPDLDASAEEPATVWKHNFQDSVGSYRFDQHRFSANRSLASVNNHVTDGWVAVSDNIHAVLVAQSAAFDTSFAFCPMRVRTGRRLQRVLLNPFGTYTGAQLRYPTALTGLGRAMALMTADQLASYAPSYAGRRSRFSLMLAPYSGDRPPETVQRDALIFATPPVQFPAM